MNQHVHEKINELKELARAKGLPGNALHDKPARKEDNLLKSIRNKKEADLFMSELEALANVQGKV